jgi:hypothetical protein
MTAVARVLAVLALAAGATVATVAASAQQPRTKECNGIRECISVPGPWVIVPNRADVTYLLECPQRRGIVGGLDALASSRDVRVSFAANLGAPVSPGTTTTRYAVFRAITVSGRRGAFKPVIGCIPTDSSGRSTTAVRVATPGPPLEYAQTTFLLRPGAQRRSTLGCAGGQRLVGTWHAIAFDTAGVPRLGLADAVRVKRTRAGRTVAVTVGASEALPRRARAQVQVGVVCAG